MWFALGAASSILDGLQSLGSSKSTSGQSGSGLFDLLGGSNSNAATATSPATLSGASATSQIAPQTMSALISAQSDASAASTASASATASANASYTDPLQDLFSQIDGNGDGQISKSEFETALGAGGTNIAQADDVFSKMDKDGNGSVSMDEMKSALQGAGGHHGHHHLAQAPNFDSSGTSSDGSSSSDALSGASAATSSYNLIEKMFQQEANSLSSSVGSTTFLSV